MHRDRFVETPPETSRAVSGHLSAGGGGHREIRFVFPFGSLAFFGALGSLMCCYFVILAGFALGLGTATSAAEFINPHLQAVIMWGLALVAVYALWQDRKYHSSSVPIALGAVASVILMATLYIRYDTRIELLSYILLVVSALLNQNAYLGALNRTVGSQADEIEELNRELAAKVEIQGREIDRLGQLKRFLSPHVAELVVNQGEDRLLDSHRKQIACLFCDLRDFTALSEAIEPEEVMSILKSYHLCVDSLVSRHDGTIGFRSGDGVMAFFNDPVTCERPVLQAVRTAVEVRNTFGDIRGAWSSFGHPVGLGIGIASGYATMGLVGSEGRLDYTAIGGVVNLAARLCDRAEDAQILIARRAFAEVELDVHAEDLGHFDLKGVSRPTDVHNVIEIKERRIT